MLALRILFLRKMVLESHEPHDAVALHGRAKAFCCKIKGGIPLLVEESLTHLLQYRFINRAKRLLCSCYLFRTCEYCGTEFQHEAWFRKHTCPYCLECDRHFPSTPGFTGHLKTHRTYICKVCGQKFPRQSYHNRHVTSHKNPNQEDSELGMTSTPFSFSSITLRKCVETHQYFPQEIMGSFSQFTH